MRRSAKGLKDVPTAEERHAGQGGADQRRDRNGRAAAPARQKSFARELVETIVLALVLAMIIKTFVIQAFKIPSGSMLNTLQIGDHILVNKFIYRFADPTRGDIIVFLYPEDESRDFIKRIIGLPGDTLEVRDRVVYINGKPLKEAYTIFQGAGGFGNPHTPFENFPPTHVPEGKYFMMGDNRDSSMDSRAWGFLDRSKIRGKALIIYWSWRPDPNAPELAGCSLSEPVSCLVLPWSLVKLWGYNLVHLADRVRWDRIGTLVR
ncbi:MAG TPA: signal peptidase I [Candidatus Methylomirabilis sp.]|jgi:signal peptidase I